MNKLTKHKNTEVVEQCADSKLINFITNLSKYFLINNFQEQRYITLILHISELESTLCYFPSLFFFFSPSS